MARFITSVSASTMAALVTSINTTLAALVNPTLRTLDYKLDRQDGRIGDSYNCTIRYDDGGAVLATPFLVRIDQGVNLAVPNAAVQTFLTANPAYFVGPTRVQLVDGDQEFKKYSLMTLYNVTGGASANYSPL
jgi:hypothetical protein